MEKAMHKVFISYHHGNDQRYKEALVEFGERNFLFVDRSVDTDDIPDEWTDQQIRRAIRDKNLRDSTVTITSVPTLNRINSIGYPTGGSLSDVGFV